MGFHKEGNYSKGIGDALLSSKTSGHSCQNHQTRPETGENVKHLEKPNACPFPLTAIEGSLEGNERNIEEKGWENY